MNAFAEARLSHALWLIDCTIAQLGLEPTCSADRDRLQKAKGELAAMRQLLELEETLDTAADTQRPSLLQVVR